MTAPKRKRQAAPFYDHDFAEDQPYCKRCGKNAFIVTMQRRSCVSADSNVIGISHLVAARRKRQKESLQQPC